MTREERVQHCMEIMRNLKWVRGTTARVLAKEWDMKLDAVENISSEAWRRVKAEVTDVDRVTTKVSLVLEQVIDDALVETREPAMIDGGRGGVYQESPNGARRVIVEASKTWAALVGANAPTKVQIGELEKLSDEEVEKRRRELLDRLKGEE